jgi:lipopolysaccharide transport system permease protein
MTAQDAVQNDNARARATTWRIEPTAPNVGGQLAVLWRFRRLFWPLTVTALFDVFRNAVLGLLWMVIFPLLIAVPAIFIVGKVFGVSTGATPLPLFVLSGLAIWTGFRRGIQWMTKSMNSNRKLLHTVYVPPLMLLIASIAPGVFQLLVVLGVTVLVAIYYGPVMGVYYGPFGWQVLAVVPAMLLILILAIAVSCFTSILNAFARDTWLTLRFILGGWMLATPIVYPVSIIPEPYRWLVYLNPLTAPVELFRWALIGYGHVPWHYLGLSAAVILIVLYFGLWFFARLQNRLFDHI